MLIKKFLQTFVLSAAAILLIFLAGFYFNNKMSLSEIKIQAKNDVSLAANLAFHDFLTIIGDLKILSGNKLVIDLFDKNTDVAREDGLNELVNLVKARKFYDQARLIDEHGMEILRVEFNGNTPVIVPAANLQDKSDRYYFRDTIGLPRGAVFVSQFDLNVENGKIEKPFKPVLRFATPIIDSSGHSRGILILNFLGKVALNIIRETVPASVGIPLLLDYKGNYLIGHSQDEEWGSVLGSNKSFRKDYPRAWNAISKHKEGQVMVGRNLFTFSTIHASPIRSTTSLSVLPEEKRGHLTLVIHTIPERFSWEMMARHKLAIAVLIGVLMIAAVVSWFYSRNFIQRQKTEKALHEAEKHKNRIVDTALDGIVTIDAEGMVVEFNPAAEKMFGYAIDDVRGKNIADLTIPGHLQDSYRAAFAHFMETGEGGNTGQYVEVLAVRKNGEEFPVELTAFSNVIQNERFFTAFLRDITKRKKAEEKTRQSQQIEIVVSDLLKIAIAPLSLKNKLDRSLELIQSICWFSVLPKGSIFLADEKTKELTLFSQRGLDPHLIKSCAKIPFGKCLCGRAASTRRIVFSDHMDERHEITYDGIQPHGHYCAPVTFGDQLLAVLNLYVEDRHVPSDNYEEVLSIITNTLASMIKHEESQRKLVDKIRELDFQKFALDEHAIVSITDIKGNITYANDRFCDTTGYSCSELIGKNHRIVNSGLHSKEFFADMWQTIANGKVWRGHVRNRKKDGTFYWVDATIVPHLNEKGKPFQYIAIRTNITKQVEAVKEADKANQAKSEFLSSMSHELRTPMNAILGFSQMLEFNPKEPLTKAQKECVDHITKGGRHLLDLINDILDLARIEAGKVEMSIENISPANILDECLPLITTMAEEHGINITVPDPAEDVRMVRADHTRFKQVLLNLMSNAVKYNRQNGTVSIGIEETDNNMLRISVTDTGEGIPEDKQDELFKPFSRLGAESTEIEGTGIGLVVCKNLVELMNGNVGLESVVGKGSTFWVELPIAEQSSESIDEIMNADDTSAVGKLPGMSGTLLYVEDNPDNIKLMKLIVSRIDGLSMIHTHTGELGIELARAEKPDVIILDINLPGMNGIETLKKLRCHEAVANIPVLALSAAATESDIRKGMEAGFLHYLTKPINVPEVVDAIKKALEAA